jgi:hypothetical protein
MSEFDFYIDKKITMWVREYHSIDADTLAEAKDKMIKAFNENSFDDTYDTTESLYGTETDMEPGDNNGESTAELFCSDTEELLTTNIK